jgi:hypothetical protein
MTNPDLSGTPDAELVRALAKPFSWPRSGLEPLPWFPFTVAASRGRVEAAERVAQRAERAYWYLRKLFKFTPRFRLLVLDRDDWTQYAELATYGVSHFTAQGNLVVGAEPADAWHDIARELARRLPAESVRALVRVHGADRVHPNAPDLSRLAEALVAHDLARVVVEEAGARFPAAWMKHAFANYALVAVLGHTDPGGLHRLGTLAEAVRALESSTPDVTMLGSAHCALSPFEAALVQLTLTRAAYAAYAEDEDEPLARWFAYACRKNIAPITPDADHEIGRMLAREVHPELGALVAGGREWREEVARAA